MKKVLIGSPVRQKNTILKEFLISLEELCYNEIEPYYFFVDDNIDPVSSKLLLDFSKRHKNTLLKKAQDYQFLSFSNYLCNQTTHIWKKDLIYKITEFKDDIINYARENDFDYLFFIDSDIVLHKNLLQHLISRDVDIVSEIFWTQWLPGSELNPQVWVQDEVSYYIRDWDNPLTNFEKGQAFRAIRNKLKIPGIYPIGGLGACTLINKNSLKKGVSFSIISNLSFWGEDRHFCARAGALGLGMFVDTVYPAYHIYRESLLNRVEEYKRDGWKFDMGIANIRRKKQPLLKIRDNLKIFKQKIKDLCNRLKRKLFLRKRKISQNNTVVLSMIVHNEEGRFLERTLDSVKDFVDKYLIIDDCSTDNTIEIIKKKLEGKDYKLIINKTSMFKTEYKLRKKQWKETLKMNPGWILSLDADEIFENTSADKIKLIIDNSKDIDIIRFKMFDMWNEKQYREDSLWTLSKQYSSLMIRYHSNYQYKFRKTNQHCGRLPKNINIMDYVESDIKIKHMGWSRESDRIKKYERYMKLDPDGKCGNLQQYQSILDKKPRLLDFEE